MHSLSALKVATTKPPISLEGISYAILMIYMHVSMKDLNNKSFACMQINIT